MTNGQPVPEFLGGVFHGAFLGKLEDKVYLDLFGESNALKPYAIFPPPPHSPPNSFVSFGVLLFSKALRHLDAIVEALSAIEHFQDHSFKAELNLETMTACMPGQEPRPMTHLQFGSLARPVFGDLIPSEAKFPTNSIGFEWITPLSLGTVTQRDSRHPISSPRIHSVAKSIVNRIVSLEPEWAKLMGLGSAEWELDLHSLREASIMSEAITEFRWQYKNKSLVGLIGSANFHAEISSRMHALIHLGTWFGVGQHTSLGHGMYQIKTNHSSF
jgi:CRISPR-associated endoribonuclease Cas6